MSPNASLSSGSGEGISETEIRSILNSQRIAQLATPEAKRQETVMSALIWGAVTSEVAYESAFRFKRFCDQQPYQTQYLTQVSEHCLTIEAILNNGTDASTPRPIIEFRLQNGMVVK